MTSRILCEHYHEYGKCKECDAQPKFLDVLYDLLDEFGWESSEQTKKELIQELEERVLYANRRG